MRNLGFAALSIALILASGVTSRADVIYQTNDPFGGFFGLIGFDDSADQSVAVRFTPSADYTLDSVSVWFMNNSDTGHGQVNLSLRNDTPGPGGTIPGNTIYDQWTFNVTALGWDPHLEVVNSQSH